MKKAKKSEKINLDEFCRGMNGSSRGHRKKARQSRALELRSWTIFVQDKISGLKEEIKIPEGHYSRKQMQKLVDEAFEKLILSLLAKRKKK